MKSEYDVKQISKDQCKQLLNDYHYLSKISKGFKSKYNLGLFKNDIIVGVIIFTGFPVPELVKGIYNLDRTDQDGFFELSRLVLSPEIQSTEHNIASWFVSKAIKNLKSDNKVRAILSYADSAYHDGTLYRACNFKYYGLSDKKKDFWIKLSDNSFEKLSRGKTKNIDELH